jgi:very-short-patch-repair endonuclease
MSQFGNFRERAAKSDFPSALDETLSKKRSDWISDFEKIVQVCESPIEVGFAQALFLRSIGDQCSWRIGDQSRFFGSQVERTEIAPQFKIESIYREKSYRVDFAVIHRHRYGDESRLVIECDGHDYHERTKEQAARDRQKDRDLQSLGWKVFRFTGSEIHADADDCVIQLFEQIGDDGMYDYQRAQIEGRAL